MNTTVAIIAPGLIGGSLALALEQQGGWEVRIWARDVDTIQETKMVLHPSKVSSEFDEIIPGSKIIVFCTPISAMGKLARQISSLSLVDDDAVVTDVGSVKTTVAHELFSIFGDRFVGGHPMAGSERNGIKAARSDLFLNTLCILTPYCASGIVSSDAALQVVRNLWASIGARTVEMRPEAHDVAAAYISHLPHAAASALVKSIVSHDSSLQKFAGKGYLDTTRIAQGLPDLWVDIFLENRGPILHALSKYIDQLQIFSSLLQNMDADKLRSFLEEAKTARALFTPC